MSKQRRPFQPIEGHPDVEVLVDHFVHRHPDGTGRVVSTAVEYRGDGDSLIAAGVATAEVIAPGKKGTTRVDADGYRFFREKLSGDRYSLRFPDVDDAFMESRPGFSAVIRRRAGLEQAFAEFMEGAVWRMHRLLTRPGGILRGDASTDS
jgi:hypothetical protein